MDTSITPICPHILTEIRVSTRARSTVRRLQAPMFRVLRGACILLRVVSIEDHEAQEPVEIRQQPAVFVLRGPAVGTNFGRTY